MFTPYISTQLYYQTETDNVAMATKLCVSSPATVLQSLCCTVFCHTRLHTFLEKDKVEVKDHFANKVRKKHWLFEGWAGGQYAQEYHTPSRLDWFLNQLTKLFELSKL
jgi:hypothetical protein